MVSRFYTTSNVNHLSMILEPQSSSWGFFILHLFIIILAIRYH